MNRRKFLKTFGLGIGAISGISLWPEGAEGAAAEAKHHGFVGILIDTTRCIGCRSCESACAEAHGNPIPDIRDDSVFDLPRKTSASQLTVVNRYRTDRGTFFVKTQCMHCNQPGCVAPCLVKAMVKKREGPVVWNTNCMGCRICMVSCPFDMPKFEFESPTPRIQKCDLCWDRLKAGEPPACVEACPQEALVFGTRRQLIEEANKRIYHSPKKYVRHIYGEHEVGGTGQLYISAVPFGQLGFRTDTGSKPYPEYTVGYLRSIPFIDLLWAALLAGMSILTREKADETKDAADAGGDLR